MSADTKQASSRRVTRRRTPPAAGGLMHQPLPGLPCGRPAAQTRARAGPDAPSAPPASRRRRPGPSAPGLVGPPRSARQARLLPGAGPSSRGNPAGCLPPASCSLTPVLARRSVPCPPAPGAWNTGAAANVHCAILFENVPFCCGRKQIEWMNALRRVKHRE